MPYEIETVSRQHFYKHHLVSFMLVSTYDELTYYMQLHVFLILIVLHSNLFDYHHVIRSIASENYLYSHSQYVIKLLLVS